MLILDTHTWIWLMTGDEKIKKSGFLMEIEKAAKTNAIKIPAICVWELSMLEAKRRISFNQNTKDWIISALSAPGIGLLPLTPEIAYESAHLPGDFHGDPADRIIVASSRISEGMLLTFDKKILEYAKEGYVKVLAPQ